MGEEGRGGIEGETVRRTDRQRYGETETDGDKQRSGERKRDKDKQTQRDTYIEITKKREIGHCMRFYT